jgi:Lamin Tail Domain
MKPLAILVAAMALALATASAAQAGIQLSKIRPNPTLVPGGQNAQVNAEYVSVKNTAATAKNLRGWFIREKHSKRTFTFPGFSLCGGCTVKIHSGTGTNTATDIYWGRAKAAWANDADKAILHRAGGLIQGTCVYPKPTAGAPPPTLGKTYAC